MKLLIATILLFSTYSSCRAQVEYLVIHGTNIWVRSSPTTGKVVMKLNEGNKCRVLGKDKQEIIRGQADYWYHIEFAGKQGWVFGSQTSKKMQKSSRSFLALDEVVKAFEFDSDKLPADEEWEGDRKVITHTVTLSKGGFAIVSFNEPGYMEGHNFSWLGFKENDHWVLYQFKGEAEKIFELDNQFYLVMQVIATGGAYTIENDYILYTIDIDNKSFLQRQVIFDFASGITGAPVYGNANLKFIDSGNHRIEIVEILDHNYPNVRKGEFVTIYNFDPDSKMYKLVK